MAANDGSWIQDPFNWTDKKLNARFSSLGGTCDALGNKLSLQSKALLDEHFAIVSEKIRRSAALLTHVYIDNCYIGDKGFKTILEGLAKVNQLKVLSITGNKLSASSVEAFAKIYSISKFSVTKNDSIVLESLDMRNNILTDAAALNLYSYFDNLIELNGIPLKTTRENPSLTTLSLKEMGFRPSDMFLICSLLKETPWITELDLSRNYFDGSSLICLLDFHLKFLSHLGTINLSYNLLILGSKGKDFSALEYTKTHLMTNKNILNLVLEGMVIPTKLNANILQSLQVNRGIFGSLTPTTFEDFIAKSTLKTMAAKEKKEEKSPLLNWKPKMDIDVAFCVLNKVELCTVECTDNSYTIRPAPPFERSKN